MGTLVDLTGRVFGRLTVVERVGSDKYKNALWKCVCNCPSGKEVIVTSNHLLNGHTQSCGCYKRDRSSETHLKYKNPVSRYLAVRILGEMKDRCNNPNCKSYKNWGGRGIRICQEWLDNPQSFADWAIANGYRKGLSIERIDNNGPYCSENCKFIEIGEQSLNRRNVRLITYNGETKSITNWAYTIHTAPIKLYPLTDEQVIERIRKYFSR